MLNIRLFLKWQIVAFQDNIINIEGCLHEHGLITSEHVVLEAVTNEMK